MGTHHTIFYNPLVCLNMFLTRCLAKKHRKDVRGLIKINKYRHDQNKLTID